MDKPASRLLYDRGSEVTGDDKIKVVMGKIGLDDHYRGIVCVTQALREAGMEVVFLGTGQTVDGMVNAVVQEDADVVGLSFLCGGHVQVMRRLLARMRDKGVERPLLVVGGVIPDEDVEKLKALGVDEVFMPGTPMASIVSYVENHVNKN